ncbi:MAG: DUF1254 domain-containing protein [Rhodocyclaceae bacterium]
MKLAVATLCLAALTACGKNEAPSAPGNAQQGASSPLPGPQVTTAAPIDAAIRADAENAYLFAYPLVLSALLRDAATVHQSVNRLEHVRTLADPGVSGISRPDVDMLSSSAWLDVGKEPVLLSLPDMGKRYYFVSMQDAWMRPVASFGTRANARDAGRYAVIGPDWQGTLPAGFKAIRSPTAMVWLHGRVQSFGKDDRDAVNAIQDAWQLKPLSAWGQPAADTLLSSALASAPLPGTTKTAAPVDQIATLEPAEFFDRVARLLPANPPTEADGEQLAALRALGVQAGTPFDGAALSAAQAEGLRQGVRDARDRLVAEAAKDGPDPTRGWRAEPAFDATRDAHGRAAMARRAAGRPAAADTIGFSAYADADGQPLSGARSYVLHFAANSLPPAGAFWTLTLYGDKGTLVENSLGRYAIGNRGGLRMNADGSLDIVLAHDSPGGDKASNWLPAPRDGFSLTLRVYEPAAGARQGQWLPPPCGAKAERQTASV